MEPRVIFCAPKSGKTNSFDQADEGDNYQNFLQPKKLVRADTTTLQAVDVNGIMESPPSYSRQPPDGHEFPDFHEVPVVSSQSSMEDNCNKQPSPTTKSPNVFWKTPRSILHRDQQSCCSVRDKIAIFSNPSFQDSLQAAKITKSSENLSSSNEGCLRNLTKTKILSKSVMSVDKFQSSLKSKSSLISASSESSKTNSPLNSDVIATSRTTSSINLFTSSENLSSSNKPDVISRNTTQRRLHVRSQSLVDMSVTDGCCKADRWSLLAEQRRKGLSKLKGLVIPERVAETESMVLSLVDLPEIKSKDVDITIPDAILNASSPFIQSATSNHSRNASTSSIITPPWNSTNTDNLKYSPAFKRKSLQVYGITKNSYTDIDHQTASDIINTVHYDTVSEKELTSTKPSISPVEDENRMPTSLSLSDAPKSLESITSPTRSDCSFEYISTSPKQDWRINTSRAKYTSTRNAKEDMGRSEDDSDNDSAVSSSQSSYISRNSPPESPNPQNKCDSLSSQIDSQSSMYDSLNRRLLKPQSVEAINRKNILASAKCRSGRDLKVGSPLIQRKFEETDIVKDNKEQPCLIKDDINTVLHYTVTTPTSTISDKVNMAFIETDNAAREINESDPYKTEESSVTRANEIHYSDSNEMQRWMRKEVKNISESKATNNSAPGNNVNRQLPPKSNAGSKVTEVCDISLPLKQNILKPVFNKKNSVPLPKSLSRNTRSASVTDLRKSFEKFAVPVPATTNSLKLSANHNIPNTKERRLSLNSEAIHKKSSSVIRSSAKVTKSQSTKDIAENYDNLEQTIKKEDIRVIILRPELTGGSVGITLAGGIDYETKDITVHKVRSGSPAWRDGRLQKGDRILSINGKAMRGLSHEQSIAILKEPVPEVSVVVSKCPEEKVAVPPSPRRSSSIVSLVPKVQKDISQSVKGSGNTSQVTLIKDAAGLGFSIEGGRDSPLGDMPLLIKKIFAGGAAEKSKDLQVGDEVLSVNKTDVTSMTRIEMWTLMKRLPEGVVVLSVRR